MIYWLLFVTAILALVKSAGYVAIHAVIPASEPAKSRLTGVELNDIIIIKKKFFCILDLVFFFVITDYQCQHVTHVSIVHVQ